MIDKKNNKRQKKAVAGHNGQTSCHYRRSSLPPSFGLVISSVALCLLSWDSSMAACLGTSHGIGGEDFLVAFHLHFLKKLL